MALILIDTCIVVDHLRHRSEATEFMAQLEAMPHVSVLTLAELQVGIRNAADEQVLHRLIGGWPIIGLDAAMARLGGSLRRRYGQSHGTGIIDALLAATAMRSGARLATANRRHFPMLDDLIVPY